jgi:hypothetical protein
VVYAALLEIGAGLVMVSVSRNDFVLREDMQALIATFFARSALFRTAFEQMMEGQAKASRHASFFLEGGVSKTLRLT